MKHAPTAHKHREERNHGRRPPPPGVGHPSTQEKSCCAQGPGRKGEGDGSAGRKAESPHESLGEKGETEGGECCREQGRRTSEKKDPVGNEPAMISELSHLLGELVSRGLADPPGQDREQNDSGAGGEVGQAPVKLGEREAEHGHAGAQAAGGTVEPDPIGADSRSQVFGEPDDAERRYS